MFGMSDSLLQGKLQELIQKARDEGKQKIVSITRRVEEQEPLEVFEAAKNMQLDRMYWHDTAEGFRMAGIGSCVEFRKDVDSLSAMEDDWNELLQEAYIDDPFQKPGTGLVAFGGKTFDNRKERGDEWKYFPDASLRIPEWVITADGESYYITLNKAFDGEETVDDSIHYLKNIKEVLFAQSHHIPQMPAVTSKKSHGTDEWLKAVQNAISHIHKGDAEKIVLARTSEVTFSESPEVTAILKNLIDVQTNSYVFAIEYGSDCFVGATPERLIQQSGSSLLSTCLAGTAPRGETEAEDEHLATELLHDPKNRREHDHVVQMINDAMAPYCDNLHIPEMPMIYPLKNLQHLYTPVRARLKKSKKLLAIADDLHPTPALGGDPKEKAMAFIRNLEPLERGWYGAPIGWMDSNENGEFVVAIRSGLIRETEAVLYAGCGVMADSDPDAELRETDMKLLPMLSALEE